MSHMDNSIASSIPITTKKPIVHVHNSDEVMPGFLEKLTVGRYSPEKSVHNYLHSTGKTITDSYSYISGIDSPKAPPSPSSVLPRVDSGQNLMLDQYLNIHTYPGFQDPSLQARTSPGRPGSNFSNNREFEGVGGDGSRSSSPKRVDVPILDMPGASSEKSPSQLPKDVLQAVSDDPNKKMTFDDSAPTTAIPGPKKVPDLVKQLSAISDQQISPIATNEGTPVGSHEGTPREMELSIKYNQQQSSGAFDEAHPGHDSPMSTKSATFDLNSLDMHKLIDAPAPSSAVKKQRETAPQRLGSPIQNVIVKVEGSTVSPDNIEHLSRLQPKDPDDLGFSARSLGLDSLSGIYAHTCT